MAYHPRIECKDVASFQTTRSRNSQLWFVNNEALEEATLGYAARYATRYEVKMYALAIEGNHIQKVATFPKANRAHFMRDFNSSVARAMARFQPTYPGGPLWHRRYSAEYLPASADIEDRFFYTVLQPVNDGIVDDIREYPGYNCFEDAITGRERVCKVVAGSVVSARSSSFRTRNAPSWVLITVSVTSSHLSYRDCHNYSMRISLRDLL